MRQEDAQKTQGEALEHHEMARSAARCTEVWTVGKREERILEITENWDLEKNQRSDAERQRKKCRHQERIRSKTKLMRK